MALNLFSVLLRKYRSACYRANHAISRNRTRAEEKFQYRMFRNWCRSLNKRDLDVIVGGNCVLFGGCKHHMESLKRFSSLKVELAPPEHTIPRIPFSNWSGQYFEEFLQINLARTKVVHSHVFPWFINWCHHQQKKGLRWVHTHHNWYYPEFGRDKLENWQLEFNQAFLFAAGNADTAISVSRWQQKFLREQHNLETVYIPNGVNVTACQNASARNFQQTYPHGQFIFYAGRNDPVKNPADFVRLAAALPGFQFLMAGQGLSPQVMEDEWDVAIPANLTIRDELSHPETLDALSACSVLVVTSKREGLPTLVLEAMAMGKPVVVPNEDGCMEAVANGEYGFIYEAGCLEDLARQTLLALDDRSKSQKAPDRIAQEYDWRVVMRKVDKIYTGAS